ncbi:DEKNAAC104300 [Brettanomyces naardenensis]|uniref:DEKNAAC104300 n=1 Tax=Brettanomyces naardenensis TaxID=13370 RepID=A0A448YQA3_BRENA|nr:DEKNAAC104300 [Brettanomyces naardenensis]
MTSKLGTVKDVVLGAIYGSEPGKAADTNVETLSVTSDDYQDSDGAPVEKKSPLGYHITAFSTFYLIVQGVIGTGIFATPASVLVSMGSIGASYVLWIVGFIIVLFQTFMYVEYTSYFRHRSGAEVVYLEQSFPNPKFLVPVVYAATNVLLSFDTSAAQAFSTYIYDAAGYDASNWEIRGLGIAALVLGALITAFNSNFAVKMNNVIGFIKVIFVLFLALSSLAVLAGSTKVPKEAAHAVFDNAWAGTTTDGNSISNAILKVYFSFWGVPYAFGVVAESHPKNTVRTYSIAIPLTMFFILIIYTLVITGYYAGVANVNEIKNTGNLIAAVYFQKIFGTKASVKALSAFVSISAFGHLQTAYLSHSRSLRECGRQGVLPYPRLWTSVKPFGTPLFPIFITFLVNFVVLIAPPPGDAYNFVVDIGSYSSYIFAVLLAIGLFKLRKARRKVGLGYREFHCPTIILVIVLLFSLFVIVMAFVPPKGTLKGDDVSFFYAAYPITTIGICIVCVIYYFLWAYLAPRIGKYRHRILEYRLANGELGHKVIKVRNEDLEEWDREHAGGSNTLSGNLEEERPNNEINDEESQDIILTTSRISSSKKE